MFMEKGKIKNCRIKKQQPRNHRMMKTFNNVLNQHLRYTYYVPGTILTVLPELFHLIPSLTV